MTRAFRELLVLLDREEAKDQLVALVHQVPQELLGQRVILVILVHLELLAFRALLEQQEHQV